MAKATWNGTVLAESDSCEVVEGNQYFPPDSVNMDYFKPSNKTTTCGWKGLANYYTLEVDGQQNQDLPGTMPSLRKPLKISRAMWPFGAVSP